MRNSLTGAHDPGPVVVQPPLCFPHPGMHPLPGGGEQLKTWKMLLFLRQASQDRASEPRAEQGQRGREA